MNRAFLSPRTKHLLIAAAAALVFGSSASTVPAMAQQPVGATVLPVGTTYSGATIEQISLTSQVGYSDLDLATQSGVATLKSRIERAAKQACSQLDSLYPPGTYPPLSDQDCVKSAVHDGMAQAKKAVAGAGGEYSLR